jgi:hypothetical protein
MRQIRIWLRQRLADLRFHVREFVRRQIRKVIEIAITDLDLMGKFRDLTSSAVFEAEHLGDAVDFKSRTRLYRWLLEQAGSSGLFLEFGVHKGDSINRLAGLKRDVTWYGFDSFVGLPEAWTLGAKAGAFSVRGRLPAVRDNVRLVEGFFEQTLPAFVAEHPTAKISVLHIDCDLYSSTKTILQNLKGMLVPGSVILFDEFFNYPDWQRGECKAFMEYVAENAIAFEYIGYTRTGGQVAVKLVERSSIPGQPAAGHGIAAPTR